MPNLGNRQQELDWSLLPLENVTASAAEQIPIGIKGCCLKKGRKSTLSFQAVITIELHGPPAFMERQSG